MIATLIVLGVLVVVSLGVVLYRKKSKPVVVSARTAPTPPRLSVSQGAAIRRPTGTAPASSVAKPAKKAPSRSYVNDHSSDTTLLYGSAGYVAAAGTFDSYDSTPSTTSSYDSGSSCSSSYDSGSSSSYSSYDSGSSSSSYSSDSGSSFSSSSDGGCSF